MPRDVSINKFPPVSVGRDWIDYVALFLTIALVSIGSLGVWAANRTLKAIEQQVVEMKAQTLLNGEVAAATKINAEAIVNSERALLLVSHNAPAGLPLVHALTSRAQRPSRNGLWISFTA
jgi:hypothetical protein